MSDQGRPAEVNIFQQEEQKTTKYWYIEAFLESTVFQILITILTLYALFGDDIRVMAFRKDADIVFDGLNITCLVWFSLEIIMSVIVKEEYFLSFFFFLDSISTISLLLDISMFNEAVGLSGDTSGAQNTAALARAGRASRVGTKAGRVVRLVRLIRLVKLYKTASEEKDDKVSKVLQQRRHKRKLNSVEPQIQQQKATTEDEAEKETQESRVSKALSDLTTKKVIILVLILLFLIPLFSTDYFTSPPTSMQMQTEQFVTFTIDPSSSFNDIKDAFKQIIIDHQGLDTPIVYFNTPFEFDKDNFPKYVDSDYGNLRIDEYDLGSSTMNMSNFLSSTNAPASYNEILNASSSADVLGVLSTRQIAIYTALLSLIRTIFVSGVLTFGALMFSKDSNDLALRPLERMIEKVNKIASDPQIVTEMAVVQEADSNETVKIENTIIKIGTLLALGFGDAGTEIIRLNMKKQGDVDPMIPGIKKVAIYGFCDIRNFTDATEVLQEDVMVFVNNIGDVVHTMADRYLGSANKNIGDAFLLVWKTKPESYSFDEDNVIWHDEKYISTLADCALMSFMKVQAKINREPKILAYRQDKRLQQRMDNYKVKIGFGLHLGWGIEGAIGSIFKIDASYLSPNVNMAARLEGATKQFGVPLLISEDLQVKFSPGVNKYVRMIDKVTVKGSTQPMGLFTIDMNYDNLPVSADPILKYAELSKDEFRMLLRQKKQDFKELVESGSFDSGQHMLDNKDLGLMMKGFNQEFHDAFNTAFQKYLEGDWKLAKQLFQDALKFKSVDGPTESLFIVMQETNFQKPNGWQGYRELNEK